MLAFFIKLYSPSKWWVASCDLMRRLTLTSVLLNLRKENQIIAGLLLSYAYTVALREIKPYW